MSSRNIAVQKGVYDALTSEKRAGESFTNLLRRLLNQRQGLEENVGGWGSVGSSADRAGLRALRRLPSRSR
jgi:predicted CopG family antitoxin